MSKQDKRNEHAFSRAGARATAGLGPVPPVEVTGLNREPKKVSKRRRPWLFTIEQAAHYECY